MKAGPARVGIRELRQNLSVHLRTVAAGQTLEVTEHGRPVALLSPVQGQRTALARLATAGRATVPAGDLLDLGPPAGRVSTRMSKALRELRRERP